MGASNPICLSALGVISALGHGKNAVRNNLFSGQRPGVASRTDLLVDGTPVFVGEVSDFLPATPERLSVYDSRNVGLSIAAAEEIRPDIDAAIERYGAERIAVVMGTSTSGIAEGEEAVRKAKRDGTLPTDFDMRKQELGSTGEVLARYLNLAGPALSVSTACSSSAQALAMGRRLIRTGLADAVLAGGADSLCRLTVNGFQALSALSKGICNPFSRNRDGTMIGEGAGIFLMEKGPSGVALLGAGASTDAYSMTAPEPNGAGVEQAIRRALDDAALAPGDIDYIQLHGTGTLHNDAMESKVIRRVFGSTIPCSSSKGQTGHTLGAAGAMGAAHCWLTADIGNQERRLPPHRWDGEPDADLLSDNLVATGDTLSGSARGIFLSNTFAFGGSNVVLIFGNLDR
jgi:3-oxoacyl-[acyl-carrier-protein] synthase I